MNVKVNPLTEEHIQRELGLYAANYGWGAELVEAYHRGRYEPEPDQEETFIDWLMLHRGLDELTRDLQH